jgi:hypothetical protein
MAVAAEGPYGTLSYVTMISCTGLDHVALAELEGGSKNMMNGYYVPSVSLNTSGCVRLSSSLSISETRTKHDESILVTKNELRVRERPLELRVSVDVDTIAMRWRSRTRWRGV